MQRFLAATPAGIGLISARHWRRTWRRCEMNCASHYRRRSSSRSVRGAARGRDSDRRVRVLAHGWVHDAAPRRGSVHGGVARGGPPRASRWGRDVPPASGIRRDAQGRRDSVSTWGYHAYVELDHPSRHPRRVGDGVPHRGRTGGRARLQDRSATDTGARSERLLDAVRGALNLRTRRRSSIRCCRPGLARLRGDANDRRQIERVVDFGHVPAAPECRSSSPCDASIGSITSSCRSRTTPSLEAQN